MEDLQQDITMPTEMLPLFRLLQLVSPSLPTGGFTYSQGLEWAVDCGWVHDRQSLIDWLQSILHSGFVELELPLLKRLYTAAQEQDLEIFLHWSEFALASRETKELRLEEMNRGRAMAKIVQDLDHTIDSQWLDAIRQCQLAGFALAALKWDINLQNAALGYTWSWLENMVMAAVKLIPLGQTSGQQALQYISTHSPEVIKAGLAKNDEEIGGSCPAFSIGSCLHETQYTRLFRS